MKNNRKAYNPHAASLKQEKKIRSIGKKAGRILHWNCFFFLEENKLFFVSSLICLTVGWLTKSNWVDLHFIHDFTGMLHFVTHIFTRSNCTIRLAWNRTMRSENVAQRDNKYFVVRFKRNYCCKWRLGRDSHTWRDDTFTPFYRPLIAT